MTKVVRLRVRDSHPTLSVCESILSIVQHLVLVAEQIQDLADEPDRKVETLRLLADAAADLERASAYLTEGRGGNGDVRPIEATP